MWPIIALGAFLLSGKKKQPRPSGRPQRRAMSRRGSVGAAEDNVLDWPTIDDFSKEKTSALYAVWYSVPSSYFGTDNSGGDTRNYFLGYIETSTSDSEYKNRKYGATSIYPLKTMIWTVNSGVSRDNLEEMSRLRKAKHPSTVNGKYFWTSGDYDVFSGTTYSSVSEAVSAMATYLKLPFDPRHKPDTFVISSNHFTLEHVESSPKYTVINIVKP